MFKRFVKVGYWFNDRYKRWLIGAGDGTAAAPAGVIASCLLEDSEERAKLFVNHLTIAPMGYDLAIKILDSQLSIMGNKPIDHQLRIEIIALAQQIKDRAELA